MKAGFNSLSFCIELTRMPVSRVRVTALPEILLLQNKTHANMYYKERLRKITKLLLKSVRWFKMVPDIYDRGPLRRLT